MPSGGVFSLEPDLSLTLTILLVVITINAINFIDGLDGLAAGIVAVAALSFLVYSYTLIKTIGNSSQSLPAVSSALLAGMCLGFLPHNFYPARIFMGDIGAMLLGLMLAYGPISSTASLDPALLTNYVQNHAVNRYPTFLPLLVPAAIFVIPYADLMFAIIRRTRAGKPLMAADRQHLHHRVLNIGHSYRQSVLIMYLWAALFSVTVVSLSVVRSRLVVLEAATAVAVLTLLPVTMPRLRPWRLLGRGQAIPAVSRPGTAAAPARRPPVAAAPSAAAPSPPPALPVPSWAARPQPRRLAVPARPVPGRRAVPGRPAAPGGPPAGGPGQPLARPRTPTRSLNPGTGARSPGSDADRLPADRGLLVLYLRFADCAPPCPGQAGAATRGDGPAIRGRAGKMSAIAARRRAARATAAGSGPGSGPKLVINCARSGKDRVKDFVISFTSSPSSAKQRPVIRFVNTTGYPRRPCGAATGACQERGACPRACVVAVDPSGAK